MAAPWQWEIALFWFMLIALVAVVAAVALVALGAGGELSEAEPDRLRHPLPPDRPVHRADLAALRFPLVLRGYRMTDVDDVLDRVAAELAHRDARIAELEARLAGQRAAAVSGAGSGPPGPALTKQPPQEPRREPNDSVPHHYRDGGTGE